MTTVVIVDDHPVVRAGLCAVLEAAADVTVLATGGDGAAALQLTAQHRPDVLVLDVNLPDTSGLEVTRQLAASPDGPAILILTIHADHQTVFGLLELGAQGYLLKDEAPETLLAAVRAVARGESWLSPTIAGQVVARATHREAPAPEEPLSPLTPRETEVLCLLAQGLDNTAIAEMLVVTKRTVQNHVSAIYGKLNLYSRTQAALYAIRHGWVDAQPEAPPDVY